MKFWLIWSLKVFPALLIVFVAIYALIWALWQYLWLAFVLWIICYLLYQKFGVIGKKPLEKIINVKKYL